MNVFKVSKLADVIEPTQFVEVYGKLSAGDYVGKLAPSLGMLIEHELFNPQILVSDEFLDTNTFLSITYFNSVSEPLKLVNEGLKVIREAPIALSLTQEMGFGKTHFLTLLWHLYAQTYRWRIDQLEEFNIELRKLNYDRNVAERTLVFAIDLSKYPLELKPYEAMFEISARILERKSEFHGIKILDPKFLKNLSKLRPVEAAKTLISNLINLKESIPILVIVDELYYGVLSTIWGGAHERIESLKDLILFLKELLESSKGVTPLVFIYASAQQDVNKWSISKNKYLQDTSDKVIPLLVITVDDLEDRVKRIEPFTLKTPEIKDVLNILSLRLLKFKANKQNVIDIIQRHVVEDFTELIGKDEALKLARRLADFYPFSPSYEVIIQKLIYPTFGADLPESQHIRDLLRATASLITRLLSTNKWSECTLISIAHMVPQDIIHTMEKEHIAKEWMKIYDSCKSIIEKIGDGEIKELMLAMLSTVYTKSITENIVKLIDLMRVPEMQSRDEIRLRGSTKLDIATALIGAVPKEYFKKFNEAFEKFKKIPYLNSFDQAGLEYYILTLLPSPLELIEQIVDEERKKAGIDKDDYNIMLEYFKNHLINQYPLTSFFQSKSTQVGPPKLYLVDWTKDIISFKDKPRFIDLLDRDSFTILTVSPWSILEARLTEKTEVDYVEKAKAIIRNYKNGIPYINMFAIVIPEVTLEDLRRLCSHIASVNAASTAISYLKVSEPEQTKRRKLEMIKRREATISTLKTYFKSEQELDEVLLEIMENMHRKIENYATSLASSAVSNYTTELIRLFKTVIYYDPKTNSIVHADLRVTFDKNKMPQDFKNIYGELPSWILNAVISKCGIKSARDMEAILKEYIKMYAEKHKSELLADKKVEIESSYTVELIARGWPNIPIKPIAKSQIESAINQLTGLYFLRDPDIDKIKVSIEDTKIIIERVKVLPPPPPDLFDVAEIQGINNVTITVNSLEKLQNELSNIQAIDFSANIGGGNIQLLKVSMDVIKFLKLTNFLNKFSNTIKNASLTIYFEKRMKKENILELFRRIGVEEKMLRLRKSGESR
jgi:hypothetical protein